MRHANIIFSLPYEHFYRPMKVSIQLHTVKSDWSILIYLGFTANNFQSILYYFSEDGFCLSNQRRP